MQEEIENRELKPAERLNRKQGRPPKAIRQKEEPRIIETGKDGATKERCPSCGEMVKMNVYCVKPKEGIRYCVCPHCQQRIALKGGTVRKIS